MAIITVKIVEIRQETPTIRVLKIDLLEQEFSYKAGQWIDCYADIDDERPVVGYSLASSPSTKGFIELAVKISDNPVTEFIHNEAKLGDHLYIEGGQGSIFYDKGMSEKVVLTGGGIGFAPLMGILRYIDETTDASVQVFQSASSFNELIYYNELVDRASKNPRLSYHPTVSSEAKQLDIDTGRITGEMFDRYGTSWDSLFYLSGPGEMIPELKRHLLSRNVPEKQIKYEKWW
jgi:ferredoxin-NADP reductase